MSSVAKRVWRLTVGLTHVLAPLILLSACTRIETPLNAQGRLDSFLENVPIYSVDLDSLPVDTLVLDQTIGADSDEAALLIGRAMGITLAGDSVFIADAALETILVASVGGRIDRTIGRAGAGPGEFTDLFDIDGDGNSFFVHELGKRVQILDGSGRYVGALPLLSGSGNVAIDKERIFIPGGRNHNAMIEVRSKRPPFDVVGRFLPPLIAPGFQPAAFNTYQLAADADSGELYAAYSGIPLIVVFDSTLVPVDQIRLTGKPVDSFERPPLVEVATAEAIFVPRFFQALELECHDLLLVGHLNTLYALRRELDRFTLVGHYVLVSETGKVLNFRDIAIYRGRLYLASPHEEVVYSGRVPSSLSCSI